MDLWIRSQDKSTLKCVKDVCCNCNNEILVNRNVIDEDYCDFDLMGKYKTRERALEVLDEIQKLLIGDFLVFKNTNFEEGLADYIKPYNAICMEDKHDSTSRVEFIHRDCIVFEMPEK